MPTNRLPTKKEVFSLDEKGYNKRKIRGQGT
jgi:hypothetical protein